MTISQVLGNLQDIHVYVYIYIDVLVCGATKQVCVMLGSVPCLVQSKMQSSLYTEKCVYSGVGEVEFLADPISRNANRPYKFDSFRLQLAYGHMQGGCSEALAIS